MFKVTGLGDESTKITISTKPYGYTGFEISDILAHNGFICEFSDPDYVTMMLTPENSKDELILLKKVLTSIPKKDALLQKAPSIGIPEAVLSPREAMFKIPERIPVEESAGRILAQTNVSCPPAIPIVVCGERITEDAIKLFKYYGIKECLVVK